MSWLSRLFGGGGAGDAPAEQAASGPAEIHAGFTIRPEPAKAAGGWRIGARIEKEVGGALRTHHLVRADVLSERDAAEAASLDKARQVIDEQGEALFG